VESTAPIFARIDGVFGAASTHRQRIETANATIEPPLTTSRLTGQPNRDASVGGAAGRWQHRPARW
jgi:hypothetical protein